MARDYQNRRRSASAEAAYRKSISIFEKTMKSAPVTASTLNDLASLHAAARDSATELQVVRRVSAIDRLRLDERSVDDLRTEESASIRHGLFRHLSSLRLNADKWSY